MYVISLFANGLIDLSYFFIYSCQGNIFKKKHFWKIHRKFGNLCIKK